MQSPLCPFRFKEEYKYCIGDSCKWFVRWIEGKNQYQKEVWGCVLIGLFRKLNEEAS